MSKSRALGTYLETLVANYFVEWFPDIKRAPTLNHPLGDFIGFPVVLEAKNQKKMTLAAWVDQAEKSGIRAGLPYMVVHNRPGKNVSKDYITLPVDQLIPAARAIVAELDRIEQANQ